MGLDARSERSGEGKGRRAKVGLEARSDLRREGERRRAATEGLTARTVRRSEGKERRARVGLEARSEFSGEGKWRRNLRWRGRGIQAGPRFEAPEAQLHRHVASLQD